MVTPSFLAHYVTGLKLFEVSVLFSDSRAIVAKLNNTIVKDIHEELDS